MKHLILAAIAASSLAACAKTGMSASVRTDITTQMQSAAPSISDCYKAALRENRKLAGLMVVEFVAAASSGAFQSVQIVRDDLQSPALQQCVVEAVSGLKLAQPQKTNVAATYPLDFAPNR